jgi:hypothetical protein
MDKHEDTEGLVEITDLVEHDLAVICAAIRGTGTNLAGVLQWMSYARCEDCPHEDHWQHCTEALKRAGLLDEGARARLLHTLGHLEALASLAGITLAQLLQCAAWMARASSGDQRRFGPRRH